MVLGHIALERAYDKRLKVDDEVADAPIFWPTDWVASGTATLEYRPADNLSLRLEYRHDHAADDVYFGGAVELDAELTPVPDRRAQDTVTAGITAWL